jgi:hypothetical protein
MTNTPAYHTTIFVTTIKGFVVENFESICKLFVSFTHFVIKPKRLPMPVTFTLV